MHLTFSDAVTYCFVFNTEPDGVGVIADTRLSALDLAEGIRPLPGQVIKVYALRQRAFVAVAGRTDHLAMLLQGIQDRLHGADDARWYDIFIEHCEQRFRVFCEAGLFSKLHPPEAALIYGDTRHHRGETKCRAVRLVFGFTDEGPARRRDNIGPGEARSIGWSAEGRLPLDEAGKHALGELYNRSLIIREMSEADIRALGHVTPGGGPRLGIQMDTTGARDASFSPVLRRFAAERFQREGPLLAVEPVTVLCGAAEMAIYASMQRLRTQSVPGHEGVGDEFHSASLTLRHGFRVYNGEQLAFIPSVRASTSSGPL